MFLSQWTFEILFFHFKIFIRNIATQLYKVILMWCDVIDQFMFTLAMRDSFNLYEFKLGLN